MSPRDYNAALFLGPEGYPPQYTQQYTEPAPVPSEMYGGAAEPVGTWNQPDVVMTYDPAQNNTDMGLAPRGWSQVSTGQRGTFPGYPPPQPQYVATATPPLSRPSGQSYFDSLESGVGTPTPTGNPYASATPFSPTLNRRAGDYASLGINPTGYLRRQFGPVGPTWQAQPAPTPNPSLMRPTTAGPEARRADLANVNAIAYGNPYGPAGIRNTEQRFPATANPIPLDSGDPMQAEILRNRQMESRRRAVETTLNEPPVSQTITPNLGEMIKSAWSEGERLATVDQQRSQAINTFTPTAPLGTPPIAAVVGARKRPPMSGVTDYPVLRRQYDEMAATGEKPATATPTRIIDNTANSRVGPLQLGQTADGRIRAEPVTGRAAALSTPPLTEADVEALVAALGTDVIDPAKLKALVGRQVIIPEEWRSAMGSAPSTTVPAAATGSSGSSGSGSSSGSGWVDYGSSRSGYSKGGGGYGGSGYGYSSDGAAAPETFFAESAGDDEASMWDNPIFARYFAVLEGRYGREGAMRRMRGLSKRFRLNGRMTGARSAPRSKVRATSISTGGGDGDSTVPTNAGIRKDVTRRVKKATK